MPDDSLKVRRTDLRFRDVLEKAGFKNKGYVWNEMFMYAASDASIASATLWTVALAAAIIFGVLTIFCDVRAAVACTLTVVVIDVDLVGLMVAWDVPLNAVAFTVIVVGWAGIKRRTTPSR